MHNWIFCVWKQSTAIEGRDDRIWRVCLFVRVQFKSKRRFCSLLTLVFSTEDRFYFLVSGNQEIIKVREWIPHLGPLTKVIPLKLFLDMVPNSSEDATRTMRGQPKRLSRNYLRRNGGNAILYVLISFHSRDVFCTLSRLFVRPGFRLFCARLAVQYLAVYSVLGSLRWFPQNIRAIMAKIKLPRAS